jgi:hypothetical protein
MLKSAICMPGTTPGAGLWISAKWISAKWISAKAE